MTIREIKVWDFRPAFQDGPYVMSHVTQETAYGRILQIRTSDGYQGWGEIVFAPSISEEQRQHRILDEDRYLRQLAGRNIEALPTIVRQMQKQDTSWRGIAFGIETAYFDTQAKRAKLAVAELLGGTVSNEINDYFSISESTVQRIRTRVSIAGPNRKVIQLKLGIGTHDDDVEHISAALDAMSEIQTLLADANGGWSVERACETIACFDDERLIWEEPCSTYTDNVAVARRSNKSIMVDQCVGDIDTAIRAVNEKLASAICIKPAFLGGLTPARQIRDLCVRENMKMRIDGPWCGDIATSAILHLAAGVPTNLLVAGCDLREPLVIEPNFGGVVTKREGRIAPPIGHGLGIDVPENALGQPAAVYL